jgi:hypothetical protein
VEDFSLSVDNILLQIESSGFRNTKVFHVVGNRHAGFFTYSKKMVDGRTACKNHRGVVENIDLLLPELFGRYPFHLNERPEINLHIVLLRQVEIWGFWR